MMGMEMTIAGPTPVNYEQERAELEAVLSSPPFVRAPKLAHLLAYLCERLFAGETNQIKEYSIGVEVFRRGPGFDQDSDSIVRVEANRLRKRLAEYYATDGAGHRLRISIPLGQYVPDFVKIAEEPEPAVPPVSDPPPGSGRASGLWAQVGRHRTAVILAAGLIILAAGVSWLLLRHPRQPSPIAVTAPQPELPPEMAFGPPAGE